MATNFVASRPPNGDRLQRRHSCQILFSDFKTFSRVKHLNLQTHLGQPLPQLQLQSNKAEENSPEYIFFYYGLSTTKDIQLLHTQGR